MRLLALLILLPSLTQAQIYRCDGPQGPVFGDRPCGESAEIVTIEDTSSGIAPAPPDEVKDYLASKREERATERAQRQSLPAPAPAPVVDSNAGNYGYPVYWPGNFRPNRPNRPHRPRPEQPIAPPLPDVDGSGSILRPRPGG